MLLVYQNIRHIGILLCLIFFFQPVVFGQKEGNIWYFGNKAGLDFNGDHPMPLTNSQMYAPAGCATICDTSGQVLFYSNGHQVWNKNHEIMQLGSALQGDSTATQSATILQHPEDSLKYYLFTNRRYPGPDSTYFGGHWYMLDFRNNSLGRIRLEESGNAWNEGITPQATEKFLAIPYGANAIGANGKRGYWLITRQTNNLLFTVYQLDSTLRFFNEQETGSNNGSSAAGYMKANQRGDMFALACSYWVQVFWFNRGSGEITYRYHLYGDAPGNRNAYVYRTYGLEFSPSGRYLFGTGWDGGVIYRWDMSRTNSRDIRKSTKFLRHSTEDPCGALQLGPDGKIYVALKDKDHLGVIHAPDDPVPGYDETGVRLIDNETGEGGICAMGLPNALPFSWKPPPFYVVYTCLGQPSLFYYTDTVGLSGTPYWDIYYENATIPITQLPSSGAFNAYYTFPDTGNYRVEFHATYGGNEVSHTRTIRIYDAQPIDWVDTTLFCSGNDLILDAGYGAFYEWDDRDERDRIRTVEEQEYLGQEYRVKVEDYHGCVSWDTIYVLKKFSPEVERIETEKALCGESDGSATVIPVGDIDDFNYYWEEDSTETSNKLSNIPGGIYHVHVINPKTTCARITEITVPELGGADVQIKASTDSIVCPGTPVVLTASNADAYEWVNPEGLIDAQIVVIPFTDTVFRVRAFSQDDLGNQCITYADFPLFVHELTYPELGPDQTACQGDSILLTSAGSFSQWNWSNGAVNDSLMVHYSEPQLVLEVTDNNGCITSDTVSVLFNQPPTLETEATKALCGEINGEAVVIPNGLLEEYSYQWLEDNTAHTNRLSGVAAGLYHVVVTSLTTSCSSTAEILVEELGGPDTQIIPSIDSIVCPGTPITLTAINGDQFEWINPGGVNNASIEVAPFEETTYTVRGISRDEQGNECSTYVEYTVQVQPVIKPDLGGDLQACEGDTLLLIGPAGYESYNWSTGEQTDTIQIRQSQQNIVLTVGDQIGCSISDTIQVTFHPYPVVDLGEDLAICSTEPIQLSGGNGDHYLWNTGAISQSIETMTSGLYQIEITSSGCSAVDSMNLVFRNPDLTVIDSIHVKDVTCFGGEDGEIEIFAHGPGSTYAYSISGDQDYRYNKGLFKDLPSSNEYAIWLLQDSVCPKEHPVPIEIREADSLFIAYRMRPPTCSQCEDGQISITDIHGGFPPYDISWSDLGLGENRVGLNDGIYAITIRDSVGCTRTFPIELDQDFTIPNAFTPNGDGINDTWKIPILESYSNCKVVVMDKKGQIIFESPPGYPQPWNGKSDGKPVPIGTYYYLIQYLNDTSPITGNLTLLR